MDDPKDTTQRRNSDPGFAPDLLSDDSLRAFGFDLETDEWIKRLRQALAADTATVNRAGPLTDDRPARRVRRYENSS